MKKTHFTTLLILLLSTIMTQDALAQGKPHNFAQCYLNKNWKPNTEGVNCAACREKIDKEKAAKKAEKKRRDDVIAAKIKAENEAKRIAFAAEQKRKQEEAAEAKSGEVVINAQPSKPSTSQPKKAPVVAWGPKIYMRTIGENFVDIFTEAPLATKPDFNYMGMVSATLNPDNTIRGNFPPNIGVIYLRDNRVVQDNPRLRQEMPRAGASRNVFDFVNEKNQRILNSDAISLIDHFHGNWFLMGKGFLENNYVTTTFEIAGFYNVATGKFIEIQEKNYFGAVVIPNVKKRLTLMNSRYVGKEYQDTYLTYYRETRSDRNNVEQLMDRLLGGPEQWKAMLTVRNIQAAYSQDFDCILYYIDPKDQIKKVSISNEEYQNSLRD